MKLRNVLLAATILAVPVAVKAQPVSGLYVGAGAGFDYLTDTDVKGATFGTGGFGTQGFGPGLHQQSRGGFTGNLAVGYGLGNGLRLELQGNFIKNHVQLKDGAGRTPGFVNGGGDIQTYGATINALYDFDLGLGFMYPYVGVGVGYDSNSFESGRLYGINPANTPNLNLYKGGHGSFAAQAILGASFPISGVPGLSLTADARFRADTDRTTYNGDGILNGFNGVRARGTERLDSMFNVAGVIGVRYAFNAAPVYVAPAVVTPVQPTGARTYLVFFDWDRADLTARARQIVAEAAQASTRTSYTRIQVSGNADTSGTAQLQPAPVAAPRRDGRRRAGA